MRVYVGEGRDGMEGPVCVFGIGRGTRRMG